jgi:hypothetical protein
MMNHDNPNEQTIEYQFGYLRAAIAGAMLLRNVQQMKSTLGDALDHINEKSNIVVCRIRHHLKNARG